MVLPVYIHVAASSLCQWLLSQKLAYWLKDGTKITDQVGAIFYSQLALPLAEKHHQPYATTMGWLRCILSFSLLRSSILCIRGTRSHQNCIPRLPASFDLVVGELRVAV